MGIGKKRWENIWLISRWGSVNMEKVVISIIIPVYQVKLYLRECLESVRSQTYKNLEIILVDDGSDDGSEIICDEYAGKDSRFHVIHQSNRGTAYARKVGVRHSTGEYIGFIDGDDWVSIDIYKKMWIPIYTNNADMVICLKNICQDNNGYTCSEDPVALEGMYTKKEGINEICKYLFWGQDNHKEGVAINLVDKLFKRDLIMKYIEQVDDRLRYFEDAACVIPCLMEAENIYMINEPLYYYRQRMGSACHSIDTMYLEQINIFYTSILNRMQDDMDDLKQRFDKYFVSRVYEGINRIMGLSFKHNLPIYVPPVSMFPSNDRIVIYGAGKVGRDYYRMMQIMCPSRIVGWVDKQWKSLRKLGIVASSIENLKEWSYDRIIIAVLFEDNAINIKASLIRMGIETEKIFWSSPKTILDD